MRYLKKYNEGGGIPTNPLANAKTNDMLRHLSTFGEDNERKYDTSDLLNILAFSKAARPQKVGLMGGVDFSLPEDRPPADFVSYKTKKKGDTRVAEYNEEKGGYNPGAAVGELKIPSLEKLADRPLKKHEANKFRKLLNDPTLLRYFMDMMGEKDLNFRKVKILKNLSTGKGRAGSSKKGGKRCVGEGCDDILSGKALSWGDY